MKMIHAKIGTHSLSIIYVRGNFKIEKNKFIKFKREIYSTPLRNIKWEKGWIDDINNDGIVFLSLM